MKVIVPGHRFALRNLKTSGETALQFYQDGEIHGQEIPGPSCQEVLRAVIARVQHLNEEKPWPRNHEIIQKAREMIALFEIRALEIKVAKGLSIELIEPNDDGHLV